MSWYQASPSDYIDEEAAFALNVERCAGCGADVNEDDEDAEDTTSGLLCGECAATI